jgi:CubicO group peptidase (beta-lactamase class C family)
VPRIPTPQKSDDLSAWLQGRLSDHATQFGIVGAAAAVLHKGALFEAATGSLNLSSGVAATSDSLFQIGSISKVFTGVLVLQLVEQGRLKLDDAVREHLPYFRVASDEVSRQVTLRQLLAHTSGIDGEYFTDTGTDSNCIEKYVRACSKLGQLHPPGESASYCNAAFVILGALVELITGQTWDCVLRERILLPLQLLRTTTDYSELPRFRVAVGHLRDPVSRQFLVPKRLHLPRGMGPAGATVHAAARDLACFGGLFLNQGRTSRGMAILTPEAISGSLRPQADWPASRWTQTRSGLGWQLHTWCDRSVFGHDGATVGQASFLRVMPEADLAVALLTNGGPARNLYQALYGDIFRRLAGVDLPQSPNALQSAAFDVRRVLGSYANALTRAEVLVEHGQLKLKTSMRQLAGILPDQIWPLTPISDDACRVEDAELTARDILVFHHFEAPDGRARYLSLRNRDLARLT